VPDMRFFALPFFGILLLSSCSSSAEEGAAEPYGSEAAAVSEPRDIAVPLPAVRIHAPAEAHEPTGSVPIAVSCSAGVTGAQVASFGMPFPRGFVTSVAQVRVETSAGVEVPSDRRPILPWRHLRDASLNGHSLRSVLVSFKHLCDSARSTTYKVRWGSEQSATVDLGVDSSNVASRWIQKSSSSPDEHPATDNYEIDTAVPPQREPSVWVTLPSAWLMKANVRGPVSPIRDVALQNFMVGYASTYVNDVDRDVKGFEADDGHGLIDWRSEVEGWLYDRPLAIWNVYVHTGDQKWLRRAHRASQYYAQWIATDNSRPPFRRGAFVKKEPTWPDDPGDAKYSLAGGLFTAYMMTGDARLLDKIRAIAEFHSAHNSTRLFPFAKTTGLWTERHLAAALASAVYAFEATGEAVFRNRALEIVRGMHEDVTRPPRGYPSAAEMRGVLFHRAEVHEGGSTDDLYMCPWMAALLGEALWRYFLVSDDELALRFLSDYSQLIAERAIYRVPEDPHLGGYWAPWYGIGTKRGYTDNGIYDDVEHAIDVLGLLARGRWARQRLGLPNDTIEQQMARLRKTGMYTFAGWNRDSESLPRYRISPTRKYGWWFGTTYDLDWLGVP
jgi:hypothetical protein